MSLPARFLDELRARLPLSAFIGQHVQLQRAGREWKACCPFHNEKSASFYVNDAKGFYHCFGCGAHGDVIGFAMNHLRQSFPEAIENLAAQAGLPVPARTIETKEQTDKRTRLYECVESAAQFYTRQLHMAGGKGTLDYLKNRGLSDETIAAWRLGYAPDDSQSLIKHLSTAGFTLDEMMQVGLVRKSEKGPDSYGFFRGRVMFPVTDIRDRVVAFGARILQGDGPKYINSPEHALFKKGELLFGAAMARRVEHHQPLVLSEGYMDVIAMWQAGFAAVAPLGTALTELQLQALWRAAQQRDDRTPVLCFDGDNAGMRAAARALNIALQHLNTNQTLNFVFLPQGEDPDSLIKTRGPEAFTQALKQALPLYDVLYQQAIAGKRTQSPEDRALLETVLAAAIAPVKDPTLRRYYEKETKDRLWQLFSRKKTSTGFGGKAGNQNYRLSTRNAVDQTVRTAPINADYMRAQVLLATLINYPDLISEAEEWLLAQNLPSETQENIRKNMLEALQNIGLSLDADSLKSYLTDRCGATVISALLNEAYEHAGFARPNRSLDEARIGWLELQQTHTFNKMRDDVQAAGRDLAHQLDETSLSRMLVLQAEMHQLPDALAMLDGNDAAPASPTLRQIGSHDA